MKYLQQFCLVLAVTFMGEVLHNLLSLPIPSGIYGLLLMLFLLSAHVIQLDQVERVGDFLVEIMPVMFIASASGLLTSWNELKPFIIPIIVTLLLSTWLAMGISGKVTQALLNRKERRS